MRRKFTRSANVSFLIEQKVNPLLYHKKLLQEFLCFWCCLHFREGDLLETDHNIPRALGGKDEYLNLQLLHGHCHDEKTALDLVHIRNQRFMKYMDYINQTLAKSVWFWDENDILNVS